MFACSDPFDSTATRDGGAVTMFIRSRSGKWESLRRVFPKNIAKHSAFGGAIAFSADCHIMGVGATGVTADANEVSDKPSPKPIDAVFVFTVKPSK